MRVLLTSSPGIGHLFPLVNVAWTLRTAGHEVVVATAAKVTEAAVAAGLPAVDLRPDFDFEPIGAPFRERFARLTPEDMTGRGIIEIGTELFTVVAEHLVERGVAFADHWRPDLVVHSPIDGVGPLVAARLGVPAVAHEFGVTASRERRALLREKMAPVYERFGVTGEPPRSAVISIAPPSMYTGDDQAWTMRYVPYNAGGALPEWLLVERTRPRVAVTLGTVFKNVTALRSLVSAARELDVEFVLALGGADPSPLGELPDNVRVTDWVPLNALLAASDAIVHHGGSGTTMTAMTAGLPQIVLPQGADQHFNAVAVVKRGLGLAPEETALDADTVRTLFSDAALRSVAEEVRDEIEAQPTPIELVPRLVASLT
ncbi:glycosyltransferase, MGT family [Streptoalloteichus tenebrarius]|uniref:Glycosyltransferase, MGT family n=1 Tax=Streptoalloteichus tenebrarius (strain ATCC 17920 / DSM 40477 / JCM 4838 / CBS 697.72 / NBRC 16177 / NCIMB 11028 / NRRL B-12390 / A12253. 1 / ISP 5477) TaxID=1933 RepID=A0ABT1HTJ5_STRSD|nr:nucleotide disphospho-sugar-binding domain-containing protein [Streptoalloteichus tenebrarius]MCP2258740.1 glycosyltransferase, MGT family [Streptoalloteichus tenebrarius]BFF02894.1 salmochelin biosynthesis C-glycosyltransferase IroB [Streptoalloteichus tenebrarius]